MRPQILLRNKDFQTSGLKAIHVHVDLSFIICILYIPVHVIGVHGLPLLDLPVLQ